MAVKLKTVVLYLKIIVTFQLSRPFGNIIIPLNTILNDEVFLIMRMLICMLRSNANNRSHKKLAFVTKLAGYGVHIHNW